MKKFANVFTNAFSTSLSLLSFLYVVFILAVVALILIPPGIAILTWGILQTGYETAWRFLRKH